jgi:hypothetical protein
VGGLCKGGGTFAGKDSMGERGACGKVLRMEDCKRGLHSCLERRLVVKPFEEPLGESTGYSHALRTSMNYSPTSQWELL